MNEDVYEELLIVHAPLSAVFDLVIARDEVRAIPSQRGPELAPPSCGFDPPTARTMPAPGCYLSVEPDPFPPYEAPTLRP